jgi:hypothetical protein
MGRVLMSQGGVERQLALMWCPDAGIDIDIAHDRVEPGSEMGFVAEGVDARIQAKKDLTGNVGRIIVVARKGVGKLIDRFLTATDQRVPGIPISLLARLDELSVLPR